MSSGNVCCKVESYVGINRVVFTKGGRKKGQTVPKSVVGLRKLFLLQW